MAVVISESGDWDDGQIVPISISHDGDYAIATCMAYEPSPGAAFETAEDVHKVLGGVNPSTSTRSGEFRQSGRDRHKEGCFTQWRSIFSTRQSDLETSRRPEDIWQSGRDLTSRSILSTRESLDGENEPFREFHLEPDRESKFLDALKSSGIISQLFNILKSSDVMPRSQEAVTPLAEQTHLPLDGLRSIGIPRVRKIEGDRRVASLGRIRRIEGDDKRVRPTLSTLRRGRRGRGRGKAGEILPAFIE